MILQLKPCGTAIKGERYSLLYDPSGTLSTDGTGGGCHCSSYWELIPNKSFMASLAHAFKLARTPEPQKSFIKAGITDENGDFTTDGKLLFNAFLLEKFGGDFKKEVVDPLLEEAAKVSK